MPRITDLTKQIKELSEQLVKEVRSNVDNGESK